MKTQRSLDKPALGRLNPVSGHLDFEKSDLIGFAPGRYIEEATQPPVICRAQPLESLHCPGRSASLSEGPERRAEHDSG